MPAHACVVFLSTCRCLQGQSMLHYCEHKWHGGGCWPHRWIWSVHDVLRTSAPYINVMHVVHVCSLPSRWNKTGQDKTRQDTTAQHNTTQHNNTRRDKRRREKSTNQKRPSTPILIVILLCPGDKEPEIALVPTVPHEQGGDCCSPCCQACLHVFGIRERYATIRKTAFVSFLICIPWFMANFAYNTSLSYTSVSSSTVISSTSSLFTFLLSLWLLNEKFTFRKFAGVLLCMTGTVAVQVLMIHMDVHACRLLFLLVWNAIHYEQQISHSPHGSQTCPVPNIDICMYIYIYEWLVQRCHFSL